MRSTTAIAALTLLPLLYACDDLGECKDANVQGRVKILTPQNRVMYAGQAILIASCSTGCHAHDAKGDQRKGAPANLDFDVVPLNATGTEVGEGNTIVATVDDADLLVGLRKRQRKVFEEREGIWAQIKDKLMPPDGVGAGFKRISPGTPYTQTADGTCKREEGKGFEPFENAATREVLREWLACGAPIVEMNSPDLKQVAPGTIGDQYPTCKVDLETIEPSFANMYDNVIRNSCVGGCHEPGGASDYDLSTPEIAYDSMLGEGQGCDKNSSPFVTPGDPDKSYVYAKITAKVGGTLPICDSPMPIGPELQQPQIDLFARWVKANAPAPGKPVAGGGDTDGGTGESDAGI